MAAMMRGLLLLALTALLFHAAIGADITVGAPNGKWDLRTDLSSWASSQTFTVGDNLIFTYDSSHDVLEVNKADYDSCSTASPITTNTGGSNTVRLSAPGTRYFICGTLGHCVGGMKVQINVVAGASSPSATPTTPSSPPSTPSPTTPTVPSTVPSTTPSAPSPSGSKAPLPSSAAPGSGLNNYLWSGLGAVMLMVSCTLV